MDEITLDNKKYISTKRASELTGYANDYVGQLCRAGKISATRIGRSWYVEESSLLGHKQGSIKDESVGIEKKSTQTEQDHTTPTTQTEQDHAILGSLEVKEDERVIIPINRNVPSTRRFEYSDESIAKYEMDTEAPLLPPLIKQKSTMFDLSIHIKPSDERARDITPTIFQKRVPAVIPSRLSVIPRILTRFSKVGLTVAIFLLVFGVLFSLNETYLASSFKQSVAKVGGIITEVKIDETTGLLKPFVLSGAAFNRAIDDTVYEFLYSPLFK